MRMALSVHSFAEPNLPQDLDGAAFRHACSDALEDMVLALSFGHHAVDAVEMQHVRKQQTRWPATNNCDQRAEH
jgi:hypothetical protein